MKKHFTLMTKILSVILVFALLCCVVPMSFGLVSAEGNGFTALSGTVQCTEHDGVYRIQQSAHSSSLSTFRVDLTKGYYFNYRTIGWAYTYFTDAAGNGTDALAFYSNQGDGQLLTTPINDGSTISFFGAPENFTHFLNWAPVKTDETVIGYQLYIDHKEVNGVQASVADFNRYNDYNEANGTFDGACIAIYTDSADIDLSISIHDSISLNANNTFIATKGSVECTEKNGVFRLKQSAGSSSLSTFRVDLTKGYYFNYRTIGWALTYFTDRGGNGIDALAFYSNQGDGQLLATPISSYDPMTFFGAPENFTHFLNWAPVKTDETVIGYQLYIDHKEVNGVQASVADFNRYNDYNEANGAFDGAYIAIHTASAAIDLSISLNDSIYLNANNTFIPTSGTAECTENNGVFTLEQSASGRSISNFRVDLTKGFYFNFTSIAPIYLYFANGSGEITNDFGVYMAKGDGQLLTTPINNGSVISFFGLSEKRTHFLNWAPVKSGETITCYQLYIDNKSATGVTTSPELFNTYNGYNEVNGTFQGAYLYVQTLGGNIDLNIGIEDYFTANSDSFDFLSGSGEYTVGNDGIFNLKQQEHSLSVGNFQVDLLKGFQFEYSNCAITYLYFTGIDGLRDSSLAVYMAYDANLGRFFCMPVGAGQVTYFGPVNNQTHYLNFVPQKSGETITGYELRVDDKPLIGGVVLTVEQFEKCNGYNAGTGTFDGTYLQVLTDTGSIDLSIKKANELMLPGDIDGMGTVDVNDLKEMRKYLLGAATVNTVNSYINIDDVIDIRDYVALKKLLAYSN